MGFQSGDFLKIFDYLSYNRFDIVDSPSQFVSFFECMRAFDGTYD